MNRIILLLVVVSIGLSAQADYTVQTQTFQPSYYNQTTQPQYYSNVQSYQQYPQYQQCQADSQNNYQNTYQSQYQNQYNPYQYQRLYGYGNNGLLNSSLPGLTGLNGTSPIVRNIAQSLIFAKLRGY